MSTFKYIHEIVVRGDLQIHIVDIQWGKISFRMYEEQNCLAMELKGFSQEATNAHKSSKKCKKEKEMKFS